MRDIADQADAGSRRDLESAILASVREAIVLVRASDGVIVYANAAWERMFGYAQEEAIGQHISIVNAPTEQAPEERAREIVGALTHAGTWSGEVHNVRKDGTRLWSFANITTLEHSAHGTLWAAVHTDITRRKAADDALRGAEERFRSAFDECPVGVALLGSDMRFTDANRVFSRITGYRRDELEGKPFLQMKHPGDVALDAELAAQVLSGEIPSYRIEERFLTKQGNVVPVLLTATVVRGSDGRVRYGIAIIEAIERR